VLLGQFFLSLSILIVLHELGHFIPAKLFNTKVEKFYLFFDPGFELFKYKHGETEYGIGWLPLGGYVKIAGMIDESMDTEQMKQPPQPWEFRSKPSWQRLIIMLGGVTVNFLLGFFIFGMVLWTWGEEYLPAQNIKHGIYVDSLGQLMGLEDGDQILKVGEKDFKRFSDGLVKQGIIFDDAKTLTVNRKGSTRELEIDPKFIGELTKHKNKDEGLFGPRLPFIIDSLPPAKEKSPGRDAGLLKNDQIISVNGQATPFYHQYLKVARANKSKAVSLDVLRPNGSRMDTMKFNITLTDEGQVGVFALHPWKYFGTERQDYTLGQALPEGYRQGVSFLGNQITAFGKMFKGQIKVTESLGGFGAIGGMFGKEWIWERFWRMTAILSLILAFMNLLPIPALDGGHVMFLLYEIVTGRKPYGICDYRWFYICDWVGIIG